MPRSSFDTGMVPNKHNGARRSGGTAPYHLNASILSASASDRRRSSPAMPATS